MRVGLWLNVQEGGAVDEDVHEGVLFSLPKNLEV
jgi:hypothetical protein